MKREVKIQNPRDRECGGFLRPYRRRYGNSNVKCYNHSFKNRTGPASPTGSTGNRPLIRSGYDRKPVNSENRPVQP